MAEYCTQRDVEIAAGGRDRLVELSDIDDTGELNDDVVRNAIVAASDWVSSLVHTYYRTPLVEVPPIVKVWTAQQAVYMLREQRRMLTESDVQGFQARQSAIQSLRLTGGVLATGNAPASSTSGTFGDDGEERLTRENTRGAW